MLKMQNHTCKMLVIEILRLTDLSDRNLKVEDGSSNVTTMQTVPFVNNKVSCPGVIFR